ncbi:MAG: hypothetical protein II844_07260 [Prevotella sp.]|nr:hypothetical protein [Prevotella sp.]
MIQNQKTAFRRLRGAVIIAAISLLTVSQADAQRKTDALDRGLVAVTQSSGVYLSWRVQADEYYDVKYNLYRNGSLVAQNLTVSNYTDTGGSSSDTYTVAAVKNGTVGSQCTSVTPWAQQYLEIPVSNVQARSGVTVWKQRDPSTAMANYTINDISLGDVDGDGKVDFIVKRKNQTDQDNLFPTTNYQMFCQIECYASSIDYGRLWWIDCGPNICYGADEQWDAVAFDWNEDGACEVLYRGGANTIIHHADGTTETIGSTTENIRSGITHTANMTFTNAGEEWLIYINGQTGYTYDVIEYPLPRGNASDWGDSYGHRSSKYFMGAPYLDGVNPYIFLGRGIYTKTDACTYRVNKSTNKLYKVGNTWHSYTNAGWYGQGNHNFSIADVDEDGSDEIIYGSMVLDFHTSDTSLHGCSSTSLGHGDASHTGDLDPFRPWLETFACNEENPCNNFRNAATCEIYARTIGSSDDGRSMAGNFTNEYPGGIGASTGSGIVPLSYIQSSPTSPTYISSMTNNWNAQTPYPMALNWRIYWDGDLLSETINGPGSSEGYLYVDKLGSRIYDTGHGNYETACINGTKKNPCATGDILGDWREEIVMRSADNRYIRVYTTVTPTSYRIPSLWYDHQYRQAMVWQTEGYNQPPHPSFFVGELEGLTQAPPPSTWTNRTGIGNGGTISTSYNGKDVLVWPDGNGSEYSVAIASGAKPSTIYLNSRTTIEGGDLVNYTETKHTWDRIRLTGYGLSGSTNVCKQGSSAAHLPYVTHSHTGNTDVWQGALICYGSISNSPVWANRFTELFLGSSLDASESYYKSVEMEYGSALYICNHSKTTPYTNNNGYGHMSVGTMTVKEGSRVVFDINGSANASGDKLDMTTLNIRTQDWEYGPQYLAPVVQINSSSTLAPGKYALGNVGSVASGSLSDIIIEANIASTSQASLTLENGVLYLKVTGTAYDQVYNLDFESTSTNNYGFTVAAGSVETMARVAESSGNHFFHIYLGNNNNRTVNLSFANNSNFTSASNYTFEFDLALVSGSANASTVSVIGSNGTLCNITFAGKASTATVTNGSGTTLGSIACDPYLSSHATISSTYYPSQFYHFTITGNSSGVKLTVTRNGSTIINSATLSSSFATIQSLQNVLGRWYSHVAYDNITLTSLVSVNAKAASFDVEEAEEEATAINEAPAETKAPVVIGYTTLDGRPVQAPVPGTIYLERKSDGTVRKVLFR